MKGCFVTLFAALCALQYFPVISTSMDPLSGLFGGLISIPLHLTNEFLKNGGIVQEVLETGVKVTEQVAGTALQLTEDITKTTLKTTQEVVKTVSEVAELGLNVVDKTITLAGEVLSETLQQLVKLIDLSLMLLKQGFGFLDFKNPLKPEDNLAIMALAVQNPVRFVELVNEEATNIMSQEKLMIDWMPGMIMNPFTGPYFQPTLFTEELKAKIIKIIKSYLKKQQLS